ncbi:MAG: hypothetical protein ABI182_03435 [Candidatus Baltobacteraceae bacterium]
MPLILTQHASRDLNRYLDREGLIYHFPAQYLPVVNRTLVEAGDRRFLYQRPVREAPVGEAGTYFGHGILSEPYRDEATPGHYWIDILNYQRLRPVPLRDHSGLYYETGLSEPIMLRGRSIRYVEPMRYFSILAAGHAYSAIPEPVELQDSGVFAPTGAPMDAFREMLVVPPGTGYVPKDNLPPDRYEAAALHERARGDHQATVKLLMETISARGGTCFFNNNVDLLARIGGRRLLIEVKSLTRQSAAVNRMRYGIGQLMDYRVRYKAEIAGAEPILAFGTPPEREVGWIPNILQENGIAFVSRHGSEVTPGNELAQSLPIFQQSP